MAQLILEISEDLARHLEDLANSRNKSVEQIALERLCSLDAAYGSPKAILRAVRQQPNVSSAATDELEAAILSGRLPVRDPEALEN